VKEQRTKAWDEIVSLIYLDHSLLEDQFVELNTIVHSVVTDPEWPAESKEALALDPKQLEIYKWTCQILDVARKFQLLEPKNINKSTPLTSAAQRRLYHSVRLLTEYGANVDYEIPGAKVGDKEEKKGNALIYALQRGAIETAKWLVRSSNLKRWANETGLTTLHLLARQKYETDIPGGGKKDSVPDAIKMLLEHDYEAQNANQKKVKGLLEEVDQNKRTPLHHLCAVGKDDLVNNLDALLYNTFAILHNPKQSAQIPGWIKNLEHRVILMKDKDGLTALALAAKTGKSHTLLRLLTLPLYQGHSSRDPPTQFQLTRPVDEPDNSGDTALMHAKNVSIAKALIKNGANANKKNKSGKTALDHVIKTVVQLTAPPEEKEAKADGKTADAKADVKDAKDGKDAKAKKELKALPKANKELSEAKELLDWYFSTRGEKIKTVSLSDDTMGNALITIVELGNLDVLTRYIGYFSEPHIVQAFEKAVIWDRSAKFNNLVDFLAKRLSVNGELDQSAILVLAAENGSVDSIYTLHQWHNFDIVSAEKKSLLAPLHAAASAGKLQVVKKLIELGAPVDAVCGEESLTPLMYACDKEREEIVKYLAGVGSHRANLNAVNKLGQTALLRAASRNQWEVISWLRKGSQERAKQGLAGFELLNWYKSAKEDAPTGAMTVFKYAVWSQRKELIANILDDL